MYDHKAIEKKWQDYWMNNKTYKTGENQSQPKFYILDMFPYPSGAGLHVGHPKGYIATDIFARAKIMQGYNVLHPMGWDAFGLPAENYAIKNKIHPRIATEQNVDTFKKQLYKLGFTYDWEREINTTDPQFYKWTQWAFIKMFERGLAYESYEPINWCPSCKTGLANEDLEDGKCERCGSDIEQKPMRQWVIKITDYAQRMLDDLEKLPHWEEATKEMQKNWIGRSEGATVEFPISNFQFPNKSQNQNLKSQNEFLEVFTTRPDTLFGCTYMVVAPEHPLIKNYELRIKNYDEVKDYIEKAKKKTNLERTELQKEKTGIQLEGLTAVNPVNNEEIPIYVADYVMMGYGTGAIMAVPAHDERDFEFAKKYRLPIKKVVEASKNFVVVIKKSLNNEFYNEVGKFATMIDGSNSWEGLVLIYTEEVDRVFDIAENNFNGDLWYIHSEGNNKKILFHNGNENTRFDYSSDDEYQKAYEYGLKIGISEEQLDWRGGYAAFTGKGININSGFLDGLETKDAKAKMINWLEMNKLGKQAVNYKLKDWVFSRQRYWGEPIPIIHCEQCGNVAVPEKDLPVTLPEVDSYEPTGTGESPLAAITDWVNTVCPKCGGPAKRETNTMPQWAGSSWYYLRYIDPHNNDALIDKEKDKYWSPVDFYIGGAEHATRHLIYARFWHKFLYDIGAVNYEEPFIRFQHVGLVQAEDGRKMSKRWGNVINPDDIVEQYGADAMRVYEMFMGPFSQTCAWSTASLVGARRFLEKIYTLPESVAINYGHTDNDMDRLFHKTVKKITQDIEVFKFNTAISQLMIAVNAILEKKQVSSHNYRLLLLLLAPFAPHITEELWSQLENKDSIFAEAWPQYDENLAKDEMIELVLQINGKVRDRIEVPADITAEEAQSLALQSEKVKKWIGESEIVKVVFVPGKLVNVVIK